MGLEDVLHRCETLAWCRRSPLGPEMDGFCEWLQERGYSPWAIRSHVRHVSHFNQQLRSQRIRDVRDIQVPQVERWMAKSGRVRSRYLASAIRCVLKYLEHRGVLRPVAVPPAHRHVLEEYEVYLRDQRALANSTVRIYRHYLIPWLQTLGGGASLRSLSALSPQEIHDFFVKATQDKADTTRGQIQAALRSFLAFCAQRGYVRGHLVQAVPKVFRYRLARVPRPIAEADARNLLKGIERSSPVGRRDRAIVLLLYTYGVRGAQVRALHLEDIQWRQSRIRFRACKGGKDVLQPLTDSVGEALLDYLRHGRPPTAYPEVFLTVHAPIHPLQADDLYTLIASRLRRLRLSPTARGPHAFRHAFASRLLQSGQPLKTIADLLGHRDLNSTFIYTKIDFLTLQQLPLEWPEDSA